MFGRRKTPAALDRLKSASIECRSCGDVHEGMFDLFAFSPDHWGGIEEYESNSALRTTGDFLSEDFCVLNGEHFFVRCILEIPVDGLPEKFGFGCWSTLSRANFDKYIDGFDIGRFSDPGPWAGWFSNTLKPYPDGVNLPCWVYPQPGRQRPTIWLESPNHPLAAAQEEGIAPEDLFAIYRANGHDIDDATA